MPYTTPVVAYSTTINGTYTALTGIQNISISRGRNYLQDPFPASSCVIELIPATSYATPLAIGQYIDVRKANSGDSPAWFVGRITDVQRAYGMPYNAGTGAAPADRITITATGGTGAIGSNQLVNYSWAAGKATSVLTDLCTQAQVYQNGGQASAVNVSAQTVSGGTLDAVNDVLRTMNWVIDDADAMRTIIINPNNNVIAYAVGTSIPTPTFSDTGSSQKYTAIEYLSSNNTAFTKVVVSPEGLTPQVASTGTVYNTLNVSTYNANTADAASLATYLLNTLSGQTTPVPFVLRTNTNVAPNCLDDSVLISSVGGFGSVFCFPSIIGALITITFRGTTVTGAVQGVRLNFDLEQASVEYTISPSLGQPFTLDIAALGKLDTNRLGYP